MATEPQAGTVSTAQAMALLLMEHPDELKKLQRDGFIKPIGRDSWRLVDLVQGFARHARKPDAAAPVSAAALALHLDCVRSYLGKLVEQGVIEKKPDGRFDQDQCRAKYIAHLRELRKLSPRSEADAAFAAAKTALINIRIDEKRRSTVPIEEAMAREDKIVGMFLSALSSLPAQCAVGDLQIRRRLEQWVFKTRTAIAAAANKLADEAGEPEFERQG